jgi:hypothetical protein
VSKDAKMFVPFAVVLFFTLSNALNNMRAYINSIYALKIISGGQL